MSLGCYNTSFYLLSSLLRPALLLLEWYLQVSSLLALLSPRHRFGKPPLSSLNIGEKIIKYFGSSSVSTAVATCDIMEGTVAYNVVLKTLKMLTTTDR